MPTDPAFGRLSRRLFRFAKARRNWAMPPAIPRRKIRNMTSFSLIGPGALRAASVVDIQKAIGQALSDLAHTPLSVTIENLDFGRTMSAKLSMTVSSAKYAGIEDDEPEPTA
jgi:hypothetical protein